MTESEKAHLKEIYPRMQVGYQMAELERRRRIRETTTEEGIESLRLAFEMAAALPARPSSGLVEFYKALAKTR